MAEEVNHIPCCKPLRLLQLSCLSLCFLLLFLLKHFYPGDPPVISKSNVVFLFVTFESFLVLTSIDVFTQLVRSPTTNVPMAVILILGSIFCFASGAGLAAAHLSKEFVQSPRLLNVIALISGVSFVTSFLYLIDFLILIRFVRLYS